MLGGALAWIMAVPAATPVTVNVALVVCGPITMFGGTEATVLSLELRLTTNPPAGAGLDKFNVRVAVVGPVMVTVGGTKLAPRVTCTACEPAV